MVDAEAAVPAGLPEDARILALHVTPAAHKRLMEALGRELTDDAEDAEVAVAVVSTRLERSECAATVDSIREASGAPVVALVHPGDTGTALALLRAGAIAAVPEGRERAILAALDDAPDDVAQDVAEATPGGGEEGVPRLPTIEGTDTSTGLPGQAALDQRLADLDKSGDPPPRVVVLGVRHLEEAVGALAHGVATLVRRRLVMGWEDILRSRNVSMFALPNQRFAVLWPDGTGEDVADVLPRLAEVTSAFAPARGRSLVLAVGHAGPDDAGDASTALDLAMQASKVAQELHRPVVDAEELVEVTAARSEMNVLHEAVRHVERNDPYPSGHGQRVASMAMTIGRMLDLSDSDLGALRLASRLHDVGKTSLPPAAMAVSDDSSDEHRTSYEQHPTIGSRMVGPVAGSLVAKAVRHHHEHWDGSGFPDGLEGGEIPLLARIVAVADAYDGLSSGVRKAEAGRDPAAVIRVLLDEAGTRFDPDVVAALASMFGVSAEAQSA